MMPAANASDNRDGSIGGAETDLPPSFPSLTVQSELSMTQVARITEDSGCADGMNRRQVLGVLGAIGAAATLVGERTAEAASPGISSRRRVGGHMSGAKAAVAALCNEGVRCVFGIPGAQSNEFWDAMKSHGIEYLLVTNEFSASIMADGAARATGEVGVFNTVPGPGVTNALTGIGEAKLDSVPLVGIITDISRKPDAHAFQIHSLPGAQLLKPITKGVLQVEHQREIPDMIHQAFRLARSGEPGPVAVVVPYDLLNETWDYDAAMPPEAALPFDENAYRQALALLSNRRYRVGIYAGVGCAHASDSLTQVAELLQAPVATSISGKGVIPDSHVLAVGWGYGAQGTRAAEYAFKDVDLVLALGVKYSEVSTANYAIPCHDPVIHVDANPQNLGRNVCTTVKVHADAGLFLDRLLADAAQLQRPEVPGLAHRIRHNRSVDLCENSTVRIHCGVDPMNFYVKLREAMGRDDLLFVDVTASSTWAAEAFSVEGSRRYFTPADNQAMGWAIPASLGAQRLRPDARVVSVVGDGCFLMSAMELSTAARAGLPVKFFVINDGAYQYMRMLQQAAFRRTTATELARLDYAALAKGFGIGYNVIQSNEALADGIRQSLAMPGPVLTDVTVSYEGRESRWFKAVRESYVDKLTMEQKVRMGTRIGMRTLSRNPQND
jgi:acetolactate synthase-1/2/3 large subunit